MVRGVKNDKKIKSILSVLVLILCVGCVGVVLASTNYNAKYYRVEIEKSDEETAEEASKVFIKKSDVATIKKPNEKAKIALEKWRFLKFGEHGGLAIISMDCLVLGLGLFGVGKLIYQWNQGCSFEVEESLPAESEVGKLKLGFQKYKEEKRK